MRITPALVAALALAGCLVPRPAEALTLNFDCITNNLAADCAIGVAQLRVEAVDSGTLLDTNNVLRSTASLTFTNVGTSASSITDVYFDNGTLLGIASITANTSGVSFSQGASPPNLPGGASISPPFVATAEFHADSNPPVQPNGVNPGESLTVRFFLLSSGTFADVEQELADGRVRVGMHVQGFASGGSEGFVNYPAVPVPAALWLLASGLGGLGAMARRQKFRA